MSDGGRQDESNVQADGEGIAVGSIHIGRDLSGTISIGHTIGYTSEQVSRLINQITTTFRPKPFDGRCPYKGLDVFEEEDAELFFGREKLVDDLVERVKESRTIFITGPSGSGKSSLVRAGLMHALKQGAIKSVHSERWLFEAMKPGRDPLGELARIISGLAGSTAPGDEVREKGRTDATIFARWCEILLKEGRDKRLVIFIDQFEEIFTQVNMEEERVSFLDLLTQAATVEGGRVVILFAMRSDFLSNCATYPELNALLNQQFVQIGAMQPDDLVSAIAQPALRVGLDIKPNLIAQIINDMKGEPGALPLMQFALKDLFDSLQTKGGMIELTLEDYLERGGLGEALQRHADDSLARLDRNEQEIARSIFSSLIEIGRGTQDTRRTAIFDELVPANVKADEVEMIVRKLADARLITTDGLSGKDTVTISHEKLIDAWPWLKKLVNENRDVIALQNEIAADAIEWEENKRDASYLYTGARLANANEQLKSNKLVLSGTAREYIREGQARQRRSRFALIGTTIMVIALLILAVILFSYQSRENARQASENEQLANKNAEIASTAQAYAVESQAYAEAAQNQANFVLARQFVSLAQSINPKSSKQMIAMLLAAHSMQISPTGEASELLIHNNLAARAITRIRLDGTVNSVKFSPDGEYVASAGCDKVDETNTCIEGSARVWARTTKEERARILLDDQVNSIAFSPNGRRIVAGGGKTVLVWETATGKEISRMNHTGEVYSVAFSPDGKYVASGSSDNTGCVWKADAGEKIGCVTHGGPVFSITFSQVGELVISGSHDGTVRVWDVSTGSEIARLVQDNPVISIDISNDGKYVVAGAYHGRAVVWDIAERKEVAHITHDRLVSSVAYGPNRGYVVSGSFDDTVRVLELSTGGEIARMTHDDVVTSVAVSPDGNFVVSGSSDFTARVWEVWTGKEISRMTHDSIVTSVGFSQDGKYVMSGGNDGSLRIWEAPTNNESFRYQMESAGYKRYSPDGKYVVTISDFYTLHIRESATGKEVGQMPIAGGLTVAFDQDGKYLYIEDEIKARIVETASGAEVFDLRHTSTSGSPGRDFVISPNFKYIVEERCDRWDDTIFRCAEGSSHIWDVTTGQETAQLPLADHVINSLRFSQDGRYLVTQNVDSTATLWDTSSGQEIFSLELAELSFSGVRFSPDGNYLLRFGSNHEPVQLWETSSGSQVTELNRENGWLSNTTFSPDGRYLASSGCDRKDESGSCLEGSDRILELSTGNEISRLNTDGNTSSLIFSQDGNFVVSINRDSTARLWEATTGNDIALIPSKRDLNVSFSPDSKYFVSRGCDIYIDVCNISTIRVWETATGKEITRITRDGNLTSSDFSPDGKYLVSSGCNEIHPDSTSCMQGVINVWEAFSGREIARILTEEPVYSAFYSVTFSLNGNFIVPKYDGYIDHLWMYRAEDLIADACSRLPRNLTQDEWEQYIGVVLPHRSICTKLPESAPLPSLELQSLGSTPFTILELISSEGININFASLQELDTLPAIGPTISQRIIDYREENGPFASIEDIINVPGIGPATFEEIRDLITVSYPEFEATVTPAPIP